MMDAIAGAALLLAAASAWRRPGWPAALRTAAAAAMALAYFRAAPPWASGPAAPAALVIDGSASMAEPLRPGGPTRWAVARERVAALAPRLRGGARLFVLTDRLVETSPEALAAMSSTGTRSDLGALARLGERAPEAAAVVLFSDGRASRPEEAVAAAARLGRPLLAAGFEETADGVDAAVEDARAPRLVFAGAPLEVTAVVSWRGIPTVSGEATLWQGRRRLDAVSLAGSTGTRREVRLSASLADAGPQTLRVEIPPQPGERNLGNNSRAFVVDVARDRLRVLYIAGRPGPHYGFLRAQLKTDPAVELVSFVILRDIQDAVNFPESDLSLIPFPPPETLIQQLPTFHAVVLEEFAGASYGLGTGFPLALRDYVRRGGGLLVSGEGAFWVDGGPMRGLEKDRWLVDGLTPGPVGRFNLRAEAPDHPVAALAADARGSAAAWARLPALESPGRYLWPRLAGGRTLLAAPDGTPVLSSREEGRGRVLLLSSLTTWRWSLAAGGRGTSAYQRFWENAVRWLGASPNYRSLRLSRPEGPAPVGEVWPLSARFFGDRPPASVVVEAREADGAAARAVLKPAGEGRYSGEVVLPRPGWYTMRARAGAAEDRFAVEARADWDENADTRTDPALLERMAKAAGGEALWVEDLTARRLARWLRRGAAPEKGQGGVWLAAALALLIAEWFLRRRRGEI